MLPDPRRQLLGPETSRSLGCSEGPTPPRAQHCTLLTPRPGQCPPTFLSGPSRLNAGSCSSGRRSEPSAPHPGAPGCWTGQGRGSRTQPGEERGGWAPDTRGAGFTRFHGATAPSLAGATSPGCRPSRGPPHPPSTCGRGAASALGAELTGGRRRAGLFKRPPSSAPELGRCPPLPRTTRTARPATPALQVGPRSPLPGKPSGEPPKSPFRSMFLFPCRLSCIWKDGSDSEGCRGVRGCGGRGAGGLSRCVLMRARRGDVRLLGLAGALGPVCWTEQWLQSFSDTPPRAPKTKFISGNTAARGLGEACVLFARGSNTQRSLASHRNRAHGPGSCSNPACARPLVHLEETL